MPFLDVLVTKQTGNPIKTSTIRRHMLTTFLSFTAFSCKIGLIKTLIDKTFKINNNWKGFQNDFTKLTSAHTKKKTIFTISNKRNQKILFKQN